MIIVAQTQRNVIQPIVIIDYTRSNDLYSESEIEKYVKQTVSELTKRPSVFTELGQQITAQWKIKPALIYSLNYDYIYEHSGLQTGDSKRTSFSATIINAPNELVGLLRIQEVTSAQNLENLGDSLSRVVDSEILFPSGSIVIRTANNTILTRPFTIYSTPYAPDRFRVENRLTLVGGAYDDIIIRLELSANINKAVPLATQLKTLFANTNYTTKFNFPADQLPALTKYYPPSPLNVTLQNICIDNKLTYKLENLTYTIYSLDPKYPPVSKYLNKLTFFNSVSNTFLISNLTFSNYALATITTELFNVSVFDTILVYDDSESQVFYNLNKIADQVKTVGGKKINAYNFYVLKYSIDESRTATLLNITGSNNWLLNNIRVDALFEPAVYKNALEASA